MSDPIRLVVLGDVADWNMPAFEIGRVPEPCSRAIREADLLIANLEGPIRTGDHPVPSRPRLSRYRVVDHVLASVIDRFGKPQPIVYSSPRILELFELNANSLATLANNHVKDLGPEAVADTIALLRERGVQAVGAGADRTTANAHAMMRIRDKPIAVLNYNYIGLRKAGVFLNIFGATRRDPGAGYERPAAIRARIDRIRTQTTDAWVLLVVHAGRALAPALERAQTDHETFARLGADCVVIHHPHLYYPSPEPDRFFLGDFVFRDDDLPADRPGGFVKIEIDPASDRFTSETHTYQLREGYPIEPIHTTQRA